MEELKTYTIDGTIFEQRELVFGQWQQLNRELKGMELPEQLTQRALIAAVADKLDRLVAIVLVEAGKSPRDKDLDDLAPQLAFSMKAEQIAAVVNDFFICNQVASIVDLVIGIIANLTKKAAPTP